MIVTESKYKYPWIGIPSKVISELLFMVVFMRFVILSDKGITNPDDFSLMSILLIGGVVFQFISKVEIQKAVAVVVSTTSLIDFPVATVSKSFDPQVLYSNHC